MALDLPTFYKRTGSAIVFAIVMLTGLLWNEWSFLALACLIDFLALREFFQIMQRIDKTPVWPVWLPWVAQLMGVAVILVFFQPVQAGNMAPGILAMLAVAPALLLLFGVPSKNNSIGAVAESIGGLLYISLPMAMLVTLHQRDMILPLGLILMIWSNDTLAYLVGSFIGKHPFSPISPKKTWEGTIGGALLTLVAAGTYGYFSHKFRLIDWLAIALCATVAGTFGDLLESKLKRLADVKDSGSFMPGHGGALDRFDSLLIATPFAFIYATFFMQ
jgi:phosphatidate cytidylyltransferase